MRYFALDLVQVLDQVEPMRAVGEAKLLHRPYSQAMVCLKRTIEQRAHVSGMEAAEVIHQSSDPIIRLGHMGKQEHEVVATRRLFADELERLIDEWTTERAHVSDARIPATIVAVIVADSEENEQKSPMRLGRPELCQQSDRVRSRMEVLILLPLRARGLRDPEQARDRVDSEGTDFSSHAVRQIALTLAQNLERIASYEPQVRHHGVTKMITVVARPGTCMSDMVSSCRKDFKSHGPYTFRRHKADRIDPVPRVRVGSARTPPAIENLTALQPLSIARNT